MTTSPFDGNAILFPLLCLAASVATANCQINSGSDGRDGILNPQANTVIDMNDHPDGVYKYTSVNIPSGVIVTFVPNGQNKPVIWLVQTDCIINGIVDISGQPSTAGGGGNGGPGGFPGGNGGSTASRGYGPGGGEAFLNQGGNASFGTVGDQKEGGGAPGLAYGNSLLLPLFGGSGGGGSDQNGGGGGGGAILIAASNAIELGGSIRSNGGATQGFQPGGGGSGGGVRLIAKELRGNGFVMAEGGRSVFSGNGGSTLGGMGRVRVDFLANNFGGKIYAPFTQGFQPIILPGPAEGAQLHIISVGGIAVASNTSGILLSPDVILPGEQSNPIEVVVACANIPLNTPITVEVRPQSGNVVRGVSLNSQGTLLSSTAIIRVNVPRGGGTLLAKASTSSKSQ